MRLKLTSCRLGATSGPVWVPLSRPTSPSASTATVVPADSCPGIDRGRCRTKTRAERVLFVESQPLGRQPCGQSRPDLLGLARLMQ